MLHMTPVDPKPLPKHHHLHHTHHPSHHNAPIHPQPTPYTHRPRHARGQSSSDPNRLAPEDAFFAHSPPRQTRPTTSSTLKGEGMNGSAGDGVSSSSRIGNGSRRRRDRERGRSGSRRRKGGVWKKLLWVKQSYPDNYTDPTTFLDHLQRNPRLLPYDFWPLVADSTVIVQHVCSVIIFVCCFVGIFQERVSPVTVVSWGSLGTVVGWVVWDFWVGQEEAAHANGSHGEGVASDGETKGEDVGEDGSSASSTTSSFNAGVLSRDDPNPNGLHASTTTSTPHGLGLSLLTPLGPTSTSTSTKPITAHSHSNSFTSPASANPSTNPSPITSTTTTTTTFPPSPHPPHSTSSFTPRNASRLATAKSAVLIYSALLGLSPILKSLTKSTTSDSIWAMSCWLMCINVFFFDYGGGVGAVQFPASLSTNAALMASTVLASRLPSTTHVFSLTLFSIEVFGLFPAFRRHLRYISWRGHLFLTVFLVAAAGAGVGWTMAGPGGGEGKKERNAWLAATAGVLVAASGTALAMGACSWWLIGLQKYKNEIHGPWDPARPVIRRNWD